MPVLPAAWEAEAGRLQGQSQPQQLQDAKQLNETLSLNKIQSREIGWEMWFSG